VFVLRRLQVIFPKTLLLKSLTQLKIVPSGVDALRVDEKFAMSAEKILVVEDNAVDRSLLVKRLKAEGYDVTPAVDGSEAIRAVSTVKPDLMVLDLTLMTENRWNTPLWDGFTMLEWMRRVVPSAEFPVVVHTGSPFPDIAAKARSIGVRFVFEKNEDIRELLKGIRKILDEGRTETQEAV
jgi:CheY-like chemotaxis protein